MIRLVAIVAALLVCAAGIEVAVYGVGQMEVYFHTHHMLAHWLAPAGLLFSTACLIVAGLRRKKKITEEEPMSPLVRHDPKTGLRLL